MLNVCMCIYNCVVGFTMEPQDCFRPSSRKLKEKDGEKKNRFTITQNLIVRKQHCDNEFRLQFVL